MIIKTKYRCTQQVNFNGRLESCGKCVNCKKAYLEYLQKDNDIYTEVNKKVHPEWYQVRTLEEHKKEEQ